MIIINLSKMPMKSHSPVGMKICGTVTSIGGTWQPTLVSRRIITCLSPGDLKKSGLIFHWVITMKMVR